jgi:hypothetical protein
MTKYLEFWFRKAPGPDTDFIEVENDQGKSVNVGTWRETDGGYHVLRITPEDFAKVENDRTK